MKIDTPTIKRLRVERNWSQEDLAEASGLSLRTIQRIESGGTASLDSVGALAAALDVAPTALAIVEEDTEKTPPVPTTPQDAVIAGFRNFGDFSGTATRYEYWWFFAFVVLLLAIAGVIGEWLLTIVSLVLLVPFVAASARRLNDAGQSNWWQLFWLVPFGQIVVMIVLAMPSASESKTAAAETSEVLKTSEV